MITTENPDPLRPVELHILLALAEEPLHGYGIIRAAEETTGGTISLEAGTLYRALRRLVEAGLVIEADDRPAPELDDTRRRYYRITAAGRSAVAGEMARLAGLVDRVREKRLFPGLDAGT